MNQGNLTKNEIWHYLLQVYDGTVYSGNYTSPSQKILNTLPTLTGLTLTTNPNTSIPLEASWLFHDNDSDAESVIRILKWFKDGTLQSAYNDQLTVPATATSKDEVWNYTVKVFDGLNWSIQYNSSQITVLNSLPVASALTIPSTPTTVQNLTTSWTFTDADVGDSQISFSVTWYIDNVYNSTFDDLTTIPSSWTRKGEIWNYTLTVSDGENTSLQYNSSQTLIVNSAPTASLLTLTANPTTNSTLTVGYQYADPDNDTENANWRIYWFKDNQYQPALADSTTVNQGNLTKNEFWHYLLQVYDGTVYSGNYTSPSQKILNTLPTLTGLTLTTNPNTSIPLEASWLFHDNDSDAESVIRILKWFKDGTLQSAYNDQLTVPATATSKGEVWNYTVKVNDGLNWSIQYNSSQITVLNSLPVASDLTIPSTPTTVQNLTTSWTFTDADVGDSQISFSVTWYIDNVYNSTFDDLTTIPSSWTRKGEIWNYTLTVSDGENTSLQYNSSQTLIVNSAPTASLLTLTVNPTTNSTLTVGYQYADPDNDTENTNWRIYWFKDNQYQSSLADSTTVNQGNLTKNEIWYYKISVSDGEQYSGNYTSLSRKVLNTAPFLTALSLTTNPNTTLPLDASWSYYDNDSDSESTIRILKWYKNGNPQSIYDNLLSVPFSATSKGEAWNYTIQVYDGEAYSIQYNSSITTIANSQPTASDLTITSSPETEDDLVASWGYQDADDDPENPTWRIRWYKNGNPQVTLNDSKTVANTLTNETEWWYYTVEVYDGETYSILYTLSPSVQIMNTAPTATGISLTATPTTTDNLVADYTFNDVNEGDSEPADSWEIRWHRDNINIPTYNDQKTVPASATARDEFWHFTLQVYDGENYSILYTSPQVQILNSIPSLSGFSFTPASPTRSDNLSVNYAWNDADTPLDSESGTIIRWYREDILQPTFNDLLRVDSGYIVKGDNWTVCIRVSDGTALGTWVNTSIIIGNALPSVVTFSPAIYIPSTGLFTTNTLVATWEETDPDGDIITDSIIVWYQNLNPVTQLENATNVASNFTTKHDEWRFSINIFDGEDWSDPLGAPGSWKYGTATIANSKPLVENITLSGGQTTTDNISLNYDFYDADGDPDQSTIIWRVFPASIPSYTTELPFTQFVAGDIVYVYITPKDGTVDWGTPVDSSLLAGSDVLIQVGNTAPEFNITLGVPIILADHPAGINGTSNYVATQRIFVNYSAFVEDIDAGESDQIFDISIVDNTDIEYVNVSEVSGSQYRWYKYNTTSGKYELQLELTDSFVDPYYLHRDDQWIVSVKPRDQYGYLGQWKNSTSVTIGNSYPKVAGFTWQISRPTTSDDLEFDFIYQDWDNDPQNVSMTVILWYKNGLLINDTENITTLTSGYFIKNDNISVIIRPFDGTNWALYNYSSAIIRIMNSAPTAINVTITPIEVYADNFLNLTWLFADTDIADNQTNDWIIIWERSGVVVSALENQTIVPDSYLTKEATWKATLWVNDGTNYSITGYASNHNTVVTILNSMPIITGIGFDGISTGTIYRDDVLKTNWNYTDVDSDVQADYQTYWYRNNGSGLFILQTDYTNNTEVSISALTKGHSWYVVILIFDGDSTNGWSANLTSITITIINKPPSITGLKYYFEKSTSQVEADIRTNEFFVEDEDIAIEYKFNDIDSDSDLSRIQWFKDVTGNDSWIEMDAFENFTIIPFVNTTADERWYCVLTPSDGSNISTQVSSSVIFIESRPVIHDYWYSAITEGEEANDAKYEVSVEVTDAAHSMDELLVEFSFLYIDNITDLVFVSTATSGNIWTITYQVSLENLDQYLGTPVLVVIKIIATVEYTPDTQVIQYDIITHITFNFTIEDLTAPRVKKELTRFTFDDPTNPSNITFFTGIVEYASDITDVSVFYYFQEITNESSLAGFGASLSQTDAADYRSASMTYHNTTSDGIPMYKVTVPFDHNGTSRDILYYIVTTDSANNTVVAFDILRDSPELVPQTRFNFTSPGIDPTLVLLIVGVTVLIAIFGSLVYVKFIRKPELVGLDKELVLENLSKISDTEIDNSMDSHTLGVVISFFDQRHGPIPIIVLPEILKDNFNKLVELSDRSFSGTGFADNFTDIIPSSYDFVIAQGLRTSVMSFGYALDRPQARGGKENITFNLLVHQEVFDLIEQFKSEIKEKIQKTHILMNTEPDAKDKIKRKVIEARKYLSSIILAYESIYGTTELIMEDS